MFTKYFSTFSLLCLCRKKIDNVNNKNSTGIFFSLLIMLRMGIPWMNFFNETTVYGLTKIGPSTNEDDSTVANITSICIICDVHKENS